MRAHRWTVIACIYFVLVLTEDILAGTHQNFTGLFAMIPVLLALDWGPGVVVLGSLPLIALSDSQLAFYDSEPAEAVIARTMGVAVGVGIGAYLAQYREARETRLNHSRAAALAAQEAILPVVPGRSTLANEPGKHLPDLQPGSACRHDGILSGKCTQFGLILGLNDGNSPRTGSVQDRSEDHHLTCIDEGLPVCGMSPHDLPLLLGHVHGKRRPGWL